MKPQMICCGCKAAPAFENSALCQACIMKLASQHTARQARPQARIQQQPTPQTMAPQARPQTMASQPSTPSGPPAADETTG
jgi:predicted amidophosphoribosyltransferase